MNGLFKRFARAGAIASRPYSRGQSAFRRARAIAQWQVNLLNLIYLISICFSQFSLNWNSRKWTIGMGGRWT